MHRQGRAHIGLVQVLQPLMVLPQWWGSDRLGASVCGASDEDTALYLTLHGLVCDGHR